MSTRVPLALTSWLRDVPLAEWEQSVAWCDLANDRSFALTREQARRHFLRLAPVAAGIMVFAYAAAPPGGGRPPHPGLPLAVGLGLSLTLPLCAPYLAILLRALKPTRGRSERVRFCAKYIRTASPEWRETFRWRMLDAFDFGRCDGFHVVKLRRRELWPRWLFGPSRVVAFEIAPDVREQALREILVGRGLLEEPLGEPWAGGGTAHLPASR